ncbi:MAG: hypothetical protein IIA87_04370 [Nanoarchaeota archaeon]|nr:hypothetical protein [Nanoarchaeota archaeon]
MNILKDFRNDLLKRREVEVSEEYDVNPGFSKVLENVTEYFKVNKDVVVIKKIGSSFGTHIFLINVFIYDSVSFKEKIEPKKKEKKEKK